MDISNLISEKTIPVVMADHKGIIVNINKLFEITYGYTKEKLIGLPLSTIIPSNLRAAHHIGFSRFLNTETPGLLNQKLQLAILHANGSVTQAEHCIYAEKIDGLWVFAATIQLTKDNKHGV